MNQERIVHIPDARDNRIIVISDIHGHHSLLEVMIDRLELTDHDFLIILGDFINRGTDSLKTYEYVKTLSRRKNTLVMKGNHEYWMQACFTDPSHSEKLLGFYRKGMYETIIDAKLLERGIDIHSIENGEMLSKLLLKECSDVFNFIKDLPILAYTDDLAFVHGGCDPAFDPIKDEAKYLKFDDFNEVSEKQDRLTIVGHHPACNLRHDFISNMPYLNPEKNILFIDGGMGVKRTGELNAIILKKENGSYTYDCLQINDFERKTIKKRIDFNQETPIHINYPDRDIEVISTDRGKALCRHLSRNQMFTVFSSLITEVNGKSRLSTNYTNHFFSLEPGDLVEVCCAYEDHLLVKHKNVFGWIHSDQI